jgi:short-subunit dehydrogenase
MAEDTDASARPLAAVTGASSGIGYELTKQFLSHGFDVLACAEDSTIHDVAARLSRDGAAGKTVTAVQADLATYDGVEALARAISDAGRPLEAAALNAGVGHGGPFAETDLAGDLQVVQLNVVSVVHLAKRIIPDMVARGSGRLLLTASIASTMPGPYYATYAASKSFVLSFAEALRYELADTGVTVTALMPGPTDTEFFDRSGMENTPVASGPKDDPERVAREGFEALMSGDDHVVAGGLKNKLQAVGAKGMTDPMKAAMHSRLTKPDTAK